MTHSNTTTIEGKEVKIYSGRAVHVAENHMAKSAEPAEGDEKYLVLENMDTREIVAHRKYESDEEKKNREHGIELAEENLPDNLTVADK